jgi:hypothetical protein
MAIEKETAMATAKAISMGTATATAMGMAMVAATAAATAMATHPRHHSSSFHSCRHLVSHPCAPPFPCHHHLTPSPPLRTPPFSTHRGHHCWLIVVCFMGVWSECYDFVIPPPCRLPHLPLPNLLSSLSSLSLPFFTPCYGWLLCVGRTWSDTMGVIIASRIIIVVIILSPPSPAKERTMETCKGERERGGECLGIDTAPLPCCGRAGKASKRMFSWSSSSTTSLKTVFFC